MVPANPQIVLESPNFPRDYHPKMNCKWRLVAEKDCDDVVINFTHIVLEKNYDTLTVCLRDVCSEEELLVLTGKLCLLTLQKGFNPPVVVSVSISIVH